jgi:hypothetical protein
MNFLDLIDVFTNLTLIGNNTKRKTTIAIVILTILLLIAIVSFVIELVSILQYLSPILFFSLFGIVGVIFSIISVIALYKRSFMEGFRKSDYWIIFVTVCLLTISAASFINRKLGTKFDITLVVSENPKKGRNISRIPINIDNNNTLLRTPAEIGNSYKEGDLITITRTEGLFNFDLIQAKVR